jgi:hypothetical protein
MKAFSPALCSCRITTSSFLRQRWYNSQKRLTCVATHVSRYVAAVFMLRIEPSCWIGALSAAALAT